MQITDIKSLGVLIHDTRKAQELTQEQLSAVSGVGIRFIRELEQGKQSCQISKVLQVMRMLGINVFASTERLSELDSEKLSKLERLYSTKRIDGEK